MTLDSLARPSGCLAMVAMDQRESLRQMLARHRAEPVPDADLVRFKLAVAREVGGYASGFLIDREFGFDTVAAESILPSATGLILAVDALEYTGPGQVGDTDLDRSIDLAAAAARGACAVKLLVIWRSDAQRDRRLAVAQEFVAAAAAAGLVSVLEGVARPAPGDDPDELLVEAARELGGLRPSLYKAQVPRAGTGATADIVRVAERVTSAVPVPWVVLSQGVRIEDFPLGVELACRAGASGFLAGRAIWSDTLTEPDPVPLLRRRSVERLRGLAELVDTHGRPWRAA